MVNPFNAGINTVTNCINGLKNVITSQKSGGMTFFYKKDEATSALDAGTEEVVLGNLRSMTDKTVIIVTHRPAALKLCDRQVAFVEERL